MTAGEVKLELRLTRTNAGAGTPMVYWKADGGRFKFRYRRRPPPPMPRPPAPPARPPPPGARAAR